MCTVENQKVGIGVGTEKDREREKENVGLPVVGRGKERKFGAVGGEVEGGRGGGVGEAEVSCHSTKSNCLDSTDQI